MRKTKATQTLTPIRSFCDLFPAESNSIHPNKTAPLQLCRLITKLAHYKYRHRQPDYNRSPGDGCTIRYEQQHARIRTITQFQYTATTHQITYTIGVINHHYYIQSSLYASTFASSDFCFMSPPGIIRWPMPLESTPLAMAPPLGSPLNR